MSRNNNNSKNLYTCFKCSKNFISMGLLNAHLIRKHIINNESKISGSAPDISDSNLINTVKFELEIKELKERLNATEYQLKINNLQRPNTYGLKKKGNVKFSNIGIQCDVMSDITTITSNSLEAIVKQMQNITESIIENHTKVISNLQSQLAQLLDNFEKKEDRNYICEQIIKAQYNNNNHYSELYNVIHKVINNNECDNVPCISENSQNNSLSSKIKMPFGPKLSNDVGTQVEIKVEDKFINCNLGSIESTENNYKESFIDSCPIVHIPILTIKPIPARRASGKISLNNEKINTAVIERIELSTDDEFSVNKAERLPKPKPTQGVYFFTHQERLNISKEFERRLETCGILHQNVHSVIENYKTMNKMQLVSNVKEEDKRIFQIIRRQLIGEIDKKLHRYSEVH